MLFVEVGGGGGRKILGNHISHDFQREPRRISRRQQSSIVKGGGGGGEREEGGSGIIRKLHKQNQNHSALPRRR